MPAIITVGTSLAEPAFLPPAFAITCTVIFLISFVLLLCLCGCGGDKEKKNEAPAEMPKANDEPPISKETTGPAGPMPKANETPKFEAKQPKGAAAVTSVPMSDASGMQLQTATTAPANKTNAKNNNVAKGAYIDMTGSKAVGDSVIQPKRTEKSSKQHPYIDLASSNVAGISDLSASKTNVASESKRPAYVEMGLPDVKDDLDVGRKGAASASKVVAKQVGQVSAKTVKNQAANGLPPVSPAPNRGSVKHQAESVIVKSPTTTKQGLQSQLFGASRKG